MKNYVILLSFLCFFLNENRAQHLAAADAGSFSLEDLTITWSLGEPFVQTHVSDDIVLTEGLLQPDIGSFSHALWKELSWTFYPNPARDFLILHPGEQAGLGVLQVSMYDMHGKSILRQSLDPQQHKYVLKLQGVPPGAYGLRLENADAWSRTEPIIIYK